jgi:hypothetical protein
VNEGLAGGVFDGATQVSQVADGDFRKIVNAHLLDGGIDDCGIKGHIVMYYGRL